MSNKPRYKYIRYDRLHGGSFKNIAPGHLRFAETAWSSRQSPGGMEALVYSRCGVFRVLVVS